MIYAIDFDGTCVTHEFPAIGREIGAEPVLKRLVGEGHQLILWTMRSGAHLDAAVAWFKERGIPLFGINENPQQAGWTASPKAYAHRYIDDAAVGVPLITPDPGQTRPYVDWARLEPMLIVEPPPKPDHIVLAELILTAPADIPCFAAWREQQKAQARKVLRSHR